MQSTLLRRYFLGLLALSLFGCSAGQSIASNQSEIQQQTEESFDSTQGKPAMQKVASLPDLGPAPELTNDTWLNVDAPLRLSDLHGKVVLIDMWTFG
jgi:hypothetical protein